jgi:hypothetical protein
VAVDGLLVAETRNLRWKDRLGSSVIAPLHRNLLKLAGKGALTGAAAGSTVAPGVKVGKRL